VKIGYTKRPDFGSRRGGLGETKSGDKIFEINMILFFVAFSFVFFFPHALYDKEGKMLRQAQQDSSLVN
jgi:hypothetical protein